MTDRAKRAVHLAALLAIFAVAGEAHAQTDSPDDAQEQPGSDEVAPEPTAEAEDTGEPPEDEMTDEEAEAAYLAAMYGTDDAPSDDESEDEDRPEVPPLGLADYLGFTALGVGFVATVGALVTVMLAPRAFERAEAMGPDAAAYRAEGEALEIASASLFAVGGALMVGALIALLIKYEEREAALYGGLEVGPTSLRLVF